ncbi:MAG: c-type cytochrome [Burkholderiales bacterium]|nr:MAG: c-type cytochrome [Burkholderiales bacterium]
MKGSIAIALTVATAALGAPSAALASADLAKKYNCAACHQPDRKLVGPAWKEVVAKRGGEANAVATLTEKVRKGGGGVYGPVPMPPNPTVPDADLKALVEWVLAGGK